MTKNPKNSSTKEINFTCKLCGESKPVSDLRMATRFHPPIIMCQGCQSSSGH